MRTSAAALALILLLSASATAAEQTELYRPQHRLPAELLDLASGLMAGEGSASLDPGTGTLLLRGPRPVLDQAVAVLTRLDVPLASFQVESRSTTDRELERSGIQIEGWIELGDVSLGRTAEGPGGLRLAAGGLEQRSRREQQTVVSVREGGAAQLWTGRAVPAAIAKGREGDRVLVAPHLRAVRSGFRVRPRGLADQRIELEIQSIVSHDSLETPFSETGLATRLAVIPGEWIVLGTVERELEGETHGFILKGESREQVRELLLLRVTPTSCGSAPCQDRP